MVVLWQALKCTMVLSVSQSAFLAGSCTCLLLIISLTFFTSILYWSYPFGQAIVPPSHFLSLSLFSLHSSIHFENPISSTRHHLFFLFPSFFSQFIICQSRACRPWDATVSLACTSHVVVVVPLCWTLHRQQEQEHSLLTTASAAPCFKTFAVHCKLKEREMHLCMFHVLFWALIRSLTRSLTHSPYCSHPRSWSQRQGHSWQLSLFPSSSSVSASAFPKMPNCSAVDGECQWNAQPVYGSVCANV